MNENNLVSIARYMPAWDDASATPAAKVLTTSFAKSDGDPLTKVDEGNLLEISFVCSGTAVDEIHFQVQPTVDEGATEDGPIPVVDSVVAGVVTMSDGSYRHLLPSTDRHIVLIPVVPGVGYCVYAKRVGGDGTSACLAFARFFKSA